MSLATKRFAKSSRTDASTSDGNKRRRSGSDLAALLRRLDAARIAYRLERVRDDAIAIEVAVPGERWEIEWFESGEVEVEIFRSSGEILDARALTELFARFAD
jgi:hypothetical protein